MKEIVVISTEDAALGFAMIGLRQMAATVNDVAGLLKLLVEDSDIGLIILDERLLEGVEEEALQWIERNWQGVLTVLPAPQLANVEADYVNRLVTRAIGYQVRLN